MSYDIRIYVRSETPRKNGDPFMVIAVPEYDSPTYNLRDMFVACTGWEYKQGTIYRMEEALPHIERGVKELEDSEWAYRKYNSPNGWGDTHSALMALKSWRDSIYELLEDWPQEALYTSW